MKLSDLSGDSVIIDIRNKRDYLKNHIKEAINYSSDDLIYKHKVLLNKSNKYYIYCENGVKSNKVCCILNQLGYNINNISGGYENIKNEFM